MSVPGRIEGVQFGFGQTCGALNALADCAGTDNCPFLEEVTVVELLSEKGIRGSYNGSGDAAALLASMAELTAAGRYSVADVVTHVTDLDGIEAAFDRLRAGAGARTIVLVDTQSAGYERQC